MLDSILSAVKSQALGTLTAQGLSSDQAQQAVPLAGDSVQEGLMGALTSGNIGGLTSLLGSATGGGTASGLMSNPIVAGIVGTLVGKLTNNLGMGSGLAQTAATTLVPMFLSKIGGAAKEHGDDDGIGAADLTAVLGGGGGMLGKAAGMLGGFLK